MPLPSSCCTWMDTHTQRWTYLFCRKSIVRSLSSSWKEMGASEGGLDWLNKARDWIDLKGTILSLPVNEMNVFVCVSIHIMPFLLFVFQSPDFCIVEHKNSTDVSSTCSDAINVVWILFLYWLKMRTRRNIRISALSC